MTTRLLCFVVAALGGLASTAGAEQYWVAYEGNDFPENEGWWRVYAAGGADRWIEDGMLVLGRLYSQRIRARDLRVRLKYWVPHLQANVLRYAELHT